MLRKIGRFAASRLQGSKGKRKYDDWMKRNPWASTALTIGDIALAGYAGPKLIGGLKGMLTAQGATSAGGVKTAATAGERLRAGMQAARSAPSAFTAQGAGQAARGAGNLAMRGGRAAFNLAKENPLATAMALEGLLTGSQNAQAMRMQRQQYRDQQEQQQFLAELLAPMFMRYYGGQ